MLSLSQSLDYPGQGIASTDLDFLLACSGFLQMQNRVHRRNGDYWRFVLAFRQEQLVWYPNLEVQTHHSWLSEPGWTFFSAVPAALSNFT